MKCNLSNIITIMVVLNLSSRNESAFHLKMNPKLLPKAKDILSPDFWREKSRPHRKHKKNIAMMDSAFKPDTVYYNQTVRHRYKYSCCIYDVLGFFRLQSGISLLVLRRSLQIPIPAWAMKAIVSSSSGRGPYSFVCMSTLSLQMDCLTLLYSLQS